MEDSDVMLHRIVVIGAALFRHFAVSIDNDRSVLTLRRPEAYRPPEGAAVVPFTVDDGMPFVEARVRTGEGDPVPIRLVVDLGASHTVSLNVKAASGLRAPERTIASVIGRGVSGEVRGRVGRIRSLEPSLEARRRIPCCRQHVAKHDHQPEASILMPSTLLRSARPAM